MKHLIKQVLRRAGWVLHRAPGQNSTLCGHLQFGPYRVETDNVALLQSYRDYPDTNAVIYRLSRQLAAEGPGAFVDVGANCGDSTALAKWAAPEWPVLCVEGDPGLAALLRRNLAGLSGIAIAESYLGATAAAITVQLDKAGWNNTLKANTGSGTTIALTTLDSVIGRWPHRADTRLLKIDTEGYDVPILFGGQQLLREVNPVVIFEYNREAMADTGQNGWPVFDLLRGHGYDRAVFYDAFGRMLLAHSLRDPALLRDMHDYAEGRLGRVYYYDVVCFHGKEAEAAERFVDQERKYRTAKQVTQTPFVPSRPANEDRPGP